MEIHNASGLVSSQLFPDAWQGSEPTVVPNQVSVGVDIGPTYGDLDGDGSEEAVVAVWCDNGGGTADGQLGQSLVVFTTTSGEPAVLSVLHTTQDHPGYHTPYFDSSSVAIGRDRISATEVFYGDFDSTAGPTGRASVVWSFVGGYFEPSVSASVTVQPAQSPGS